MQFISLCVSIDTTAIISICKHLIVIIKYLVCVTIGVCKHLCYYSCSNTIYYRPCGLRGACPFISLCVSIDTTATIMIMTTITIAIIISICVHVFFLVV